MVYRLVLYLVCFTSIEALSQTLPNKYAHIHVYSDDSIVSCNCPMVDTITKGLSNGASCVDIDSVRVDIYEDKKTSEKNPYGDYYGKLVSTIYTDTNGEVKSFTLPQRDGLSFFFYFTKKDFDTTRVIVYGKGFNPSATYPGLSVMQACNFNTGTLNNIYYGCFDLEKHKKSGIRIMPVLTK